MVPCRFRFAFVFPRTARCLGFAAAGLIALASGRAQPPAPTPAQVELLREHAADTARWHADAITSAPVGLAVTLTSRDQARAFYNAIFPESENVPSGWTGSLAGTPGGPATGTAGTTSAAYQAAEQLRINWYRAMAGLPAAIAFDSSEGAEDQAAALMMAANNALSHFPPTSWVLYTAAGATAAGNSNLSLGVDGPDAITGYISDAGSNNTEAGHRRWLLYPQTQTMGSGDVDATGNFLASNATWIMDGNYNGPRPATRDTFVAWPPPGYVPYQVVFPRWSFAYPNADFTNATVTMTSNGASVPVSLEPLANNSQTGEAGENTLVWVYNGLDADTVESGAPQPSADLTYNVQVNGVVINGQSRNFSYAVTLFDPAVPGSDEVPTTITGSTAPGVGLANAYTVAGIPSFAAGFQYRTVSFGAAGTFGAEGGLQGVIPTVSTGYSVVDTGVAASGSASYHLATPDGSTQILTLPGEFSATASSATLQFASKLGFATTDQTAHVQISTNDGVSWQDLYTQTGTNGPGESSFTTHVLSLAAYAGYVFEIRFAYTLAPGGSYYPQTSDGVGWNIDTVAFTNGASAVPSAATAVASGATFSYTPVSASAVALQTQALLFETYPLSWGPVLNLVPNNSGISPTISAQPAAQTVVAGTTTVFQVSATGNPALSYQWKLNNVAISGATTARLVLTGSAVVAGSYTCSVSNSAGSVTTVPAVLTTLTTSANPGRLGNLSVLTQDGTGSAPLTVGFVSGGAGTNSSSSQRLLIRGDGPLLATTFNLSGTLPDPVISVFPSGSSTPTVTDDNWGTNATAVTAAEAATGAVALTAGSLDAALVSSLAPGAYTVQVTGNGTSAGLALAEVYDDTSNYTPATPRLVNISCLTSVGAGKVLTAGFVIGGVTSKTVLIRATGPALASVFGLAGVMPDPQLTVFNITTTPTVQVAANSGWGGDQQIVAADSATGAFALPNSGSADCAVILTLPPGNYTAQVVSASGTAGTALVEVYEYP